MKSLRKTK